MYSSPLHSINSDGDQNNGSKCNKCITSTYLSDSCKTINTSCIKCAQPLMSCGSCLISCTLCLISCAQCLLSLLLPYINYIIIWSIISELLLLSEVYSMNDTQFFTLSCSFLIVPLALVSGFIFWQAYVNEWVDETIKYLLYVPVINIPFIISNSKISDDKYDYETIVRFALLELLITGTMTFPLYIINLSYLCETITSYNEISPFNLLQLVFSVISFVKTAPVFILKLTIANEENLSFSKQIKIILSSSLGFVPIVLIEIIHFFPFIFAYYIDETLNYNNLIVIMMIFNIPKLFFIVHINRKIWTSSYTFYIFGRATLVIICTLILATVPLVPYLLIIFFKRSQKQDKTLCCDNGCCGSSTIYYWIVVIYLFISYGISCIYIIAVCGFSQLSVTVQISMLTIITLIFFITCAFPISYYCMKKNGVDLFGAVIL